MWKCFRFALFRVRMKTLELSIKRIKEKNPEKLKGHPHVQLYVAVVKALQEIRNDPAKDIFFLGNTLGKQHRDWRRAKEGMPPRYRLFFKFFSQHKEIFFAWINDEMTLRKQGAKTDCYTTFSQMLKKGTIPSTVEELKKDSEVLE